MTANEKCTPCADAEGYCPKHDTKDSITTAYEAKSKNDYSCLIFRKGSRILGILHGELADYLHSIMGGSPATVAAAPDGSRRSATPATEQPDMIPEKLRNMMLAHLDGVYLINARESAHLIIGDIIRFALGMPMRESVADPEHTHQFLHGSEVCECGLTLEIHNRRARSRAGVLLPIED